MYKLFVHVLHVKSLLMHKLAVYVLHVKTRQSAQWGTYTPDYRCYRHFLKSTKYVALTLEMAVVC